MLGFREQVKYDGERRETLVTLRVGSGKRDAGHAQRTESTESERISDGFLRTLSLGPLLAQVSDGHFPDSGLSIFLIRTQNRHFDVGVRSRGIRMFTCLSSDDDAPTSLFRVTSVRDS